MRNNHLIAVDGHADLHSEHGPNRGEHSDARSIRPSTSPTWRGSNSKSPTLIALKLSRAPSGFAVGAREPKTLYLRGSLPGAVASRGL